MKHALVIGFEGQDGTIACNYLSNLEYTVVGNDKDDEIDILYFDSIKGLLQTRKFDEIYYLAAYHHSSEEKEDDNLKLVEQSININVKGLVNVLECIRLYSKDTKLFYASSSLVFENSDTNIQNEETPYSPKSVYGITKLSGMQLCKLYRENFGVFASCGILYNHESEYRTEKFLSKKIIKGVLEIKNGRASELIIGDLSAEVDWSYAPDFIEAFIKILNVDKPDDFIIASGQKRTVKDFIETAFNSLGLNWKDYVKEDKSLIQRGKRTLVGDFLKLKIKTGWTPSTSFEEMIQIMLKKESENYNE